MQLHSKKVWNEMYETNKTKSKWTLPPKHFYPAVICMRLNCFSEYTADLKYGNWKLWSVLLNKFLSEN